LFDKTNLKYILIWLFSVFLSLLFKFFGFLNPDVLLINEVVLLFLVFGPALLVTMVLLIKKFFIID